MWKAGSALAVAAFLAGAATILPGFSPSVSASTPVAAQKTDKLATADCFRAGWPYYRAECLKDHGQNAGIARPVRLVTTDRLPAERPQAIEGEWLGMLAEMDTARTLWVSLTK
jgi:hypothetical protein